MTKPKKIKDVCRRCGQPAVAYWPAIDPDIESFPYCRKCLDEAKIKFLMEMEDLYSIKDDDE
jgi:late competence protein required for DNA uptake (superfamily II DNA/RNA helicase)